MNNLWIFGDSFSSTCFPHERSDNMKNYLNTIDSVDIKSWSELLSEKLNYDLKNFAKGGNSNYQIFQDFCDQSHLIKENDIVVIGWGLIQKFRISQNNKFINISPGNNIIPIFLFCQIMHYWVMVNSCIYCRFTIKVLNKL